MPGLLTLRPGLGSASKTAKSAGSKNAVSSSSSRTEKGRDDRSLVVQSGRAPSAAAGAFVRHGGAFRAPAFSRAAPMVPQVPLAGQPARPKQVNDPMGDVLKAKLRTSHGLDISQRVGSNYSSSGSKHEIDSVCLAEMVHEFMEDDEEETGKCGRARCNCDSGSCGDSSQSADADDAKSTLGGEIAEVLQGLIPCVSATESAILAAVSSAVQKFDDQSESDEDGKAERSFLMRGVMSSLRSSGYNAAICKSRWEHAGGFPGGDYEYTDVILGGLGALTERIIVDINFKSQFEIARPTPQYAALLQIVPAIFVGKADRLQQIVNILCDAAKRSLKKKDMPVPPWRKAEYIRAKWFTSYRRTTNEAPASSSREHNGVDFGRMGGFIGVGRDSRFTAEMETSFQKAADQRKVLRESNGIDWTNKQPTSAMAFKKQEGTTEPEGVVRGAHHMLSGLRLVEKRIPQSSVSALEKKDFAVAGR
ncbi:hypothetical protein MPTK1_2g23680 [Marchantia polymorpha subsp. ruderalis]|uniref:Uncharacterized protein n=2 Tax=Marchantia polymorpha TaxID=3197 RepID=A0A176W349_MARPO|nr:hypothetical protein AXG93_4360s1290 [Marchantia polymorpha subsp. ruderalis]PTQ35669.1 hypothetical protein MARPO_0069s0017 [Marchantia polymorpha]BBN03464.1 hypothetical protein Mp_2g23680 [Marchantia polymorpha subsp. ruderalis]|eukprot:PTQ35669.1 hypothetical protein MARPO_0069s0017 [Marchantia polymorpha]